MQKIQMPISAQLYPLNGDFAFIIGELFDIGWEDYIARGAICAVEWSENVEDAFYGDEIIVSIHKLSDNERKITIEGVELC